LRSTLDPVAIINHRASSGGPQPAEMERMLNCAPVALAEQDARISERRARIDAALARLDSDFECLLNRTR
jgi:argininosuccinate lyase